MYSPDERRSIRSEMNRDAAPSQEEQARVQEEWLRENGCYLCGEDDPEKLTTESPHTPNCDGMQVPDYKPRPVCKDHPPRDDRWLWGLFEKAIEKDAVAVVTYECGLYEIVERPPKSWSCEVCGTSGEADEVPDECQECGTPNIYSDDARYGPPIPKIPAVCPNPRARTDKRHEVEEIHYRGSDF